MKYTIELGRPSAIRNRDGAAVWSADTPEELIDVLVHELAAEVRISRQARADSALFAQQRDTLRRIVETRYMPGVKRATELLTQLLRENGDRCMLGDKHVADIKALLGVK